MAGRKRQPIEVATATGAAIKNPQRYRQRAAPKAAGPLGAPPARLDSDAAKAWKELAAELPWLQRSDRKIMEVTARLTARLMTDPDMGVSALAQLRLCLSELGATPAARSKVGAPDEEPDDPADKFLN